MKNIYGNLGFLSPSLANGAISLEALLSKANLNFEARHSPCIIGEGWRFLVLN